MAGKWGSSGGGGIRLPLGLNTCQIVDVKPTISQHLLERLRAEGKDETRAEQFEWGVQAWVNGKWEPRKIWTGRAFGDPANISSPQFTPKLNKLVRACGDPLPRNRVEAEAWDENGMIGKRFGVLVQADPEDPSKLVDYLVPLNQALPPAQLVATAPPASVPPQAQATAPPATSPTPDPFVGDAGATPPPVGAPAAAVTGSADIW